MSSSAVCAGINFYWTGNNLTCQNLQCEGYWTDWLNWKFDCPTPPPYCDITQYPDNESDNVLIEEAHELVNQSRVSIYLPVRETRISNLSITISPEQTGVLILLFRAPSFDSVLDCKTIHLKPLEGDLTINARYGVTIKTS